MLFGWFYHCDGQPGHITAHATTTHVLRIRMEVQNGHRVGGLAQPPLENIAVYSLVNCKNLFYLESTGSLYIESMH